MPRKRLLDDAFKPCLRYSPALLVLEPLGHFPVLVLEPCPIVFCVRQPKEKWDTFSASVKNRNRLLVPNLQKPWVFVVHEIISLLGPTFDVTGLQWLAVAGPVDGGVRRLSGNGKGC